MQGGELKVKRTSQGYLAVLRVQGPDGVGYEWTSHCGFDDAEHLLAEAGYLDALEGEDGVGFSFAGIARGIASAASSVAKSGVFRQFVSAAKVLPPPVGTVASVASQAANVLQGMRRGDPAALAAWQRAVPQASAAPNSATAVGMRLAMQALGRPVMGRPGAAAPAPAPRPAPAPAPAVDASPSPDARPEETLPASDAPASSSSWPFSAAELQAFMGADGGGI